MKTNISIVTTLVALALSSSPTLAQTRGTITGVQVKDNNQEEEVLPPILSNNLYLEEKSVLGIIKHGENLAHLDFTIVSKTRGRVKLRWNDANIGFKGISGISYTLPANNPRNFAFTAYGKTSGVIEVLNENDELLMTIPYRVAKDKAVNQSVGFTTSSGTGRETRIGLNYSIRQRKENPLDNVWGIRTSVTYGLDGNYQIQTNVNYQF